jgi:hypothetical protein
MPTLQTRAGAGPAVANVPSGTVAIRLANAHAKSEQLAIFLTSFVFIIVVSFCLVLLLWPSLASRREE